MNGDPRAMVPGAARVLRRAVGGAAMGVARAAARLPDGVIVAAVDVACRAAAAAKAPAGTRAALGDLLGVVRDDPRGLDAIRRIVLETRDGQLRSMIEGLLRHYVEPAAEGAARARGAARPTAMAVVGAGPDASGLAAAYARRAGWRVIAADGAGGVPAGVVEVADPAFAASERLVALLERGVAVSLSPACVETPARLDELREAARRGGTWVRVLYLPALWPPGRRFAELLAGGAIGEVASIRVQAVLGGRGAPQNGEPPDRDDWTAHPAFDHGMLLALLGGPIGRVTGYLSPMDPVRGGRGVLACAFEAPGRYGTLECAWAPQLTVSSAHLPYDLQVEAAGTDGVAWLRRGMGRRTQQAPIEVRAGKDWYQIGAGTGLVDDWDAAYEAAADDLAARLERERPSGLGDAAVRSAIAFRAGAGDASVRPGVIEL